MDRGEWLALVVGITVGVAVVVFGLLYLLDAATEVAAQVSEMIQG